MAQPHGVALETKLRHTVIAVGQPRTRVCSSSTAGVHYPDIFSRYADVLMGIANTVATIPGAIGVVITGLLVDQEARYALHRHELPIIIRSMGPSEGIRCSNCDQTASCATRTCLPI